MSTPAHATTPRRLIRTLAAVGFMLFSMFFGAGNLIFPPMLGAASGTAFPPAMTGFLVTGVVLPMITVIAVAIAGTGVQDLASRAGPLFGLIFSLVVYLSIGALYGVPRAAAIGYELGMQPAFNLEGSGWRFLGTLMFFSVAYVASMWPGRVVDVVGRLLTPALLILLAVLVVTALVDFPRSTDPATGDFTSDPFVSGITEGYFTMDSVAALAFALIVVSTLNERGVTRERDVVGFTSVAALIAGSLLLIVYVGIGYVGASMPDNDSYEDGAHLLADASHLGMGSVGQTVFSLVVLLACLTTVIGLTTATGSFFHGLVPALSYRVWALILIVVGMLIANVGLARILAVSGPIIGLIYPPAVALIVMTFAHLPVRPRELPLAYRTAVTVAFIFSLLDLLGGLSLGGPSAGAGRILEVLSWVPFMEESLGWLLPTMVLTAVAYTLDLRRSGGFGRNDAER